MDIVVTRCGALDVHKRSVTACVRTPGNNGGRREQVKSFPTYLDGLEALRDWLVAEGVTEVVMEATGPFGSRCGTCWRTSRGWS